MPTVAHLAELNTECRQGIKQNKPKAIHGSEIGGRKFGGKLKLLAEGVEKEISLRKDSINKALLTSSCCLLPLALTTTLRNQQVCTENLCGTNCSRNRNVSRAWIFVTQNCNHAVNKRLQKRKQNKRTTSNWDKKKPKQGNSC